MQRIKRLLATVATSNSIVCRCPISPMSSEVLAIGPQLPTGSDALLHKTVLASWNAYLVKIYLSPIFLAFLFLVVYTPFGSSLFRAVPVSKSLCQRSAASPAPTR